MKELLYVMIGVFIGTFIVVNLRNEPDYKLGLFFNGTVEVKSETATDTIQLDSLEEYIIKDNL